MHNPSLLTKSYGGGTARLYAGSYVTTPKIGGTKNALGVQHYPQQYPLKWGGRGIGGTIFHDWGYCLKSQKKESTPKNGGYLYMCWG